MFFSDSVKSAQTPKGKLSIYWLGQAGFLIKTPSGRMIAIDPYFSDCTWRLNPQEGCNYKRLTPPPMEADALCFDDLLMSHEHTDHFDVDSIEAMMANGRTQAYTNIPVADEMAKMGIGSSRVHILKKSEPVKLPEYTLTPLDCDHGRLAPDALGFLLDFGFITVYFSGDTSLTASRLAQALDAKPDVAILPINGEYGNLDSFQAAEYAGLLGCKICIPCHFWTFARHRGDPQTFMEEMRRVAPECQYKMLCQGEGFLAER